MSIAIQTDNLSKRYRQVDAVDAVSLEVNKGEIFGFLGLNGAGKTTTIRMLLGMVNPTKGQAYLNGQRVTPSNVNLWKEVGYLVEIPYAYPELTTRENIDIIRQLRGLPKSSVDTIMRKLNLEAYQNRPARYLSLGNKQRLGLAKAIIHRPDILILDEPANGLDPAGIIEIRKLLLDLANNHGVTIFISSHILGEVSKFATRVGIIHEGQLIQELSVKEMERFRRRTLVIAVPDNVKAQSLVKKAGIDVSVGQKDQLIISDSRAIDRPDHINKLLVEAGQSPTMLTVVEEELEDYFLRMIEEGSGARVRKAS